MPQYFKGDDQELKMVASATPILVQASAQKDTFYNEAYIAQPLGDLIYNSERSPLANAIDPIIYRETFPEIFDAFVVAGTFESYLSVFRKIFGDDVVVLFVISAPGKLQINIEAAGTETSPFVARYIDESDSYVFDDVVDEVGDFIAFQTVKGFTAQYELEQMLFELVPAGIFTEINLTIGV